MPRRLAPVAAVRLPAGAAVVGLVVSCASAGSVGSRSADVEALAADGPYDVVTYTDFHGDERYRRFH
jgi:hypothetical protein